MLIASPALLFAEEPPANPAAGAIADSNAGADSTFDIDEDRVLEEARRRASPAQEDRAADDAAEEAGSEEAGSSTGDSACVESPSADDGEGGDPNSAEPADGTPAYFTPLSISAVPGLSFPFGEWNSTLHLGVIGSIAAPLDFIQVSSIFNISGRHTFLQLAAIFNLSDEGSDVQASGVFNISDDQSDVQAAGVFNIGNYVRGVQLGGVFNINGELEGVALAGVFNISGKAKGLLLAPINIVDELDGFAIGLINIIGNGFNDISVDYQWAGQSLYASWKSGTDKLYTLVYAGVPIEVLSGTLEDTFTTGFGVGLRLPFEGFWLDGELCLENAFDGSGVFLGFPSGVDTFADYVWNAAFMSLRVAINGDLSLGPVPYIGIKADIRLPGSNAMPEYLRQGLWGSEPWVLGAGEVSVEVYPRIYAGLRL